MKMLFVLCCLTLWGWGCMAQTGEKNFIDQNYVEVTGTAEMEIVPDEIYLRIVISEKDKGKKSVEEQEKEMVNVLKNLGVDVHKDLAIRDLSSDFKYYLLKRTAIQTEKEYQLCMHGGDKIGRLLNDLEAVGISNISILRVDHSQMAEFRRKVKTDAVKIAKEKAEDFAGAVGQEIGRALYISENEGGYYPRQNAVANVRVRGMGSVDSAPVLDFEKIPLKYTVLVRFELK